MKVDYVEKTYEIFFNVELVTKYNCIFYPPGQVQEGVLGIDNAVLFPGPLGIFLTGKHFAKGVDLRKTAEKMERKLSESVGKVPKMMCNIFFQYKKPEYMTTEKAREWRHWGEPYYRYSIDDKQFERLLALQGICNKDAKVIYAAPALRCLDDLSNSFLNKTVIKDSNFQTVTKLKSQQRHCRNTYTHAGKISIACSEPEIVENFDLDSFLGEYESKHKHGDINASYGSLKHNTDFIKGAASVTDKVLEEGYTKNTYLHWREEYEAFREYPLFHSMATMYMHRTLTGTQWMIVH